MAFTKENAVAIGRLGGRPKGVLSRSKILMKELAAAVVTDLEVQNRIIADARAGTLHPGVLIAFFHYYAGRPPVKLEVALPDRGRADMVARLRQLSKADRMQYAALARKMIAAAARPTVVDVTPAKA